MTEFLQNKRLTRGLTVNAAVSDRVPRIRLYVSTLSINLPSFSTFKTAFMNKLQIKKQIAVHNNRLVEFRRKWGVLSS